MVFVSVSETYDLSTKAGKMTLIGIHTPTKDIIQKTYPGLCMNSKYCRIVKQDVALACASMQPFSADIIGVGSGDVAPEDAFNPILYKAVSNESMSTLEARLLGLQGDAVDPPLEGASVIADSTNVTPLEDEFNVYYALLSNRDGFRVANPQAGLSMSNLVPLVFEKYYNLGTNGPSGDSVPVESVVGAGLAHSVINVNPQWMRGKAHPMPRFNTTYLTSASGTAPPAFGLNNPNGMGDCVPRNAESQMPEIMPVYTACIVMPPSRLHTLFYRMTVKTTLEFTEVRPIQEIASFQSLSTDYAPMVYHTDYTVQSKMMDSTAGMIDVKDGEVTKIMEGA